MQLPLDVARCNGEDCKHKHKCARYMDLPLTEKVSMVQGVLGGCGWFLKWEGEDGKVHDQ